MEDDQFYPFSFCCFDQEEEIGELRRILMYTALELETTIITAKEETARRELELIQLKDVLSKTIKERDEAQAKCRTLALENFAFEQQQDPSHLFTGLSNLVQDNGSKASGGIAIMNHDKQIQSSSIEEDDSIVEVKKPLPEKGNLLKAVIEAGPLLQILLLAGELPKWQQPPPQLHSIEVPRMAVSSPATSILRQDSPKSLTSGSPLSYNRAMEFCESPSSKRQKIVHPLR